MIEGKRLIIRRKKRTLDECKSIISDVSSFRRMGVCIRLIHRSRLTPQEEMELIRSEWTVCDRIGDDKELLRDLLSRYVAREGLGAMMSAEDAQRLAGMPERFTVWRGGYKNNIDGLSWTLDRDIAFSFPYCMRYQQWGQQPLLAQGEVNRNEVALITARGEEEIVAPRVDVVTVYRIDRMLGEHEGDHPVGSKEWIQETPLVIEE